MISVRDLSAMFCPSGSGVLMLIKVYGDESSDQRQQHVLSVGAVMAVVRDGSIVGISEGEKKWHSRLEADHIKYFHASDCEALENEFDLGKLGGLSSARAIIDSLGCDLRAIIKNFNFLGIGVSVLIPEFQELIRSNRRALEYFGDDPKIAAYKTLIKATIQYLNKDVPRLAHLPISFLFDDHSGYMEAEKAYEELRKLQPYTDRLGTIGHGDDKKIPALQMADLIAYETRYKTLNSLGVIDAERYMFKRLEEDHSIYLFILMNAEGMLHEVATMTT